MILSERTTLLVVSAILVILQCVNCAPSSEVSDESKRTARYISVGTPAKENLAASSVEEKEIFGKYGPHGAGLKSTETTQDGGLPGNNIGNPNTSDVSVTPQEPPQQPAEGPLQQVAERPPQTVGFAAVVSTFWDMVLAFIRGTMGLKRREPPRIARAFIGAAVGKNECVKASTCHAGRMMRLLDNNAVYFTVAEMIVADEWKPTVRRIRRATEDQEDCSVYECDV